MLSSVARLNRRARTIPRRSPLTRAMPALAIATSVPVPIAMPTVACASAGASFTPSPAIATSRPSRRSDASPDAHAGGRRKFGRRRNVETPLLGGANDGRRQRMLASPLDGRAKPQKIVLGPARGNFDGRQSRTPLRQRAGLVDDERVDAA